jgi:hypothetical protein
MKKTLLLLAFIFTTSTMKSQITIFDDDFESYTNFTITNFGDWTLQDLNGETTWGVGETTFPNMGAPIAGIIFNPSACSTDVSTSGNYTTHSGDKYFTFWSIGTSGATNDKYLITPIINLENVSSPTLTFFAKSLASTSSPSITPEKFEIFLSTTGNNVADFTVNLGNESTQRSSGGDWDEFTRDLSPYIGEQIYIAIHYISPTSSYAMHVDDIKVEAYSTASISDNLDVAYSYYPNPVENNLTITADKVIENIIITNSLGQIVQTQNANELETNIDTSLLAKGVYYVSFFSKQKNLLLDLLNLNIISIFIFKYYYSSLISMKNFKYLVSKT